MSKFFIDRPIFAWVIALLITLLGAVAITQLPVAQYPSVAPPSISINSNYAGTSAETLQNTVDAESMMHFCCSHLAHLIKNGRIKNKFCSFSQTAETNKELLVERIISLGISNFLPENKCRFCNVKSESFSLLGALNLGLEVASVAIKLYKDLLNLTDNLDDKKLYKEILNEKSIQLAFLKKEKRFVSKGELKLNLIGSYCLPEIVSRLRG